MRHDHHQKVKEQQRSRCQHDLSLIYNYCAPELRVAYGNPLAGNPRRAVPVAFISEDTHAPHGLRYSPVCLLKDPIPVLCHNLEARGSTELDQTVGSVLVGSLTSLYKYIFPVGVPTWGLEFVPQSHRTYASLDGGERS